MGRTVSNTNNTGTPQVSVLSPILFSVSSIEVCSSLSTYALSLNMAFVTFSRTRTHWQAIFFMSRNYIHGFKKAFWCLMFLKLKNLTLIK